jgi:hypothetical protein
LFLSVFFTLARTQGSVNGAADVKGTICASSFPIRACCSAYDGVEECEWFRSVTWALVRAQTPPMVPSIEHALDTSNFTATDDSVFENFDYDEKIVAEDDSTPPAFRNFTFCEYREDVRASPYTHTHPPFRFRFCFCPLLLLLIRRCARYGPDARPLKFDDKDSK